MLRLADYKEDYHPSRLDWVLVQAKQLQREGSLCGCPEPLVIVEIPLTLSLGYSSEAFRASSGPLEGIVALLESTLESQGDIARENQRLRVTRIKQKKLREHLSLFFREINILEALFTCLIYRPFEGSNELSTI